MNVCDLVEEGFFEGGGVRQDRMGSNSPAAETFIKAILLMEKFHDAGDISDVQLNPVNVLTYLVWGPRELLSPQSNPVWP